MIGRWRCPECGLLGELDRFRLAEFDRVYGARGECPDCGASVDEGEVVEVDEAQSV